VSITTYFIQNFLLPSLAAIAAGIIISILGGTKWTLTRHLTTTVPILLVAFAVCWFVTREPDSPLVVAGTVLNESNRPIAHATITRTGHGENCQSEDNGNYRLDLTGKVRKSDRVPIHVSKEGYAPYDATAEVPSETFVIHLKQP